MLIDTHQILSGHKFHCFHDFFMSAVCGGRGSNTVQHQKFLTYEKKVIRNFSQIKATEHLKYILLTEDGNKSDIF